TGTAGFSFKATDYVYTTQNLMYITTPFANTETQTPTYSITWIEPLSGGISTTIKFFAIYIPQSQNNGEYPSGGTGSMVIFGDLQQGSSEFTLKCVRAIGDDTYMDYEKSGNNLTVIAEGNLAEPAPGSGFTVCTD
ncbi:MAG TPA: hypothetical protein PL195_12415, partial [bacterium]|nr:hypothetical protein [bacterium]